MVVKVTWVKKVGLGRFASGQVAKLGNVPVTVGGYSSKILAQGEEGPAWTINCRLPGVSAPRLANTELEARQLIEEKIRVWFSNVGMDVEIHVVEAE